MSYLVQCNGCKASVTIEDASDPDSAVQCAPDSGCCAEDHHHGQAANETGTPCRPITITAMGPAAQLKAEA